MLRPILRVSIAMLGALTTAFAALCLYAFAAAGVLDLEAVGVMGGLMLASSMLAFMGWVSLGPHRP